MTSWGLSNAHLEPWDFGHAGWLNERLTAMMVSPIKDVLTCEVLSWTPSTRGPVIAKAYQLILPERPSQDQLTAFFETQKAKVRGKIVMAGKQTIVPVNLESAGQAPHRSSKPSTVTGRMRGRSVSLAFTNSDTGAGRAQAAHESTDRRATRRFSESQRRADSRQRRRPRISADTRFQQSHVRNR